MNDILVLTESPSLLLKVCERNGEPQASKSIHAIGHSRYAVFLRVSDGLLDLLEKTDIEVLRDFGKVPEDIFPELLRKME